MGYAKSNESCCYRAKGGKYLLKELLDLEISRLVILRAIVARLKKMEESAGEIEEALEPSWRRCLRSRSSTEPEMLLQNLQRLCRRKA